MKEKTVYYDPIVSVWQYNVQRRMNEVIFTQQKKGLISVTDDSCRISADRLDWPVLCCARHGNATIDQSGPWAQGQWIGGYNQEFNGSPWRMNEQYRLMERGGRGFRRG